MNILALDCATATGWATWSGARLESGVQTFDLKRGESPGMRFIRFNAWLRGMLATIAPDVVVYEMGSHHRGGAATEVGVGLMTRVQEACAAANVDHAGVNTSTLKSFVLGKAPRRKKGDPKQDRSKAAMVAAVNRRWGCAVTDDDESDAIALLMYARETYDRPF